MTTYTRIFRVEGGPLAEAINTITVDRQRIGEQYILLGELIGCEQVHTWPWTGRFAGCTFAKGNEPPHATWRKSHKIWVPRKKTIEGDELWSIIHKLDPIPAIQTVLEPYGLTVHKPIIGDKPPYVEGFGDVGIYYVHVPWYDVSEEMLSAALVLDGELTTSLKFLTTFVVPNDWVEITEIQKVIEWDELDRR